MAKKTWNSLVCIFVYLNVDGSLAGRTGTQPDPADTPEGQSVYRIDFGSFEGQLPAVSIARPYDFTKGGKRNVGFTTKVTGMSPAHWNTISAVVNKVLASGEAKIAAA